LNVHVRIHHDSNQVSKRIHVEEALSRCKP
jgi:hypothetical protein